MRKTKSGVEPRVWPGTHSPPRAEEEWRRSWRWDLEYWVREAGMDLWRGVVRKKGNGDPPLEDNVLHIFINIYIYIYFK